MSDIEHWSEDAGGNNASPPHGFPEGMQPSAVNDSVREVMAAIKRFYNAIGAGDMQVGNAALLEDKDLAHVLARENHTGEQLMETISDAGALATLNTVGSSQIQNNSITNPKMASPTTGATYILKRLVPSGSWTSTSEDNYSDEFYFGGSENRCLIVHMLIDGAITVTLEHNANGANAFVAIYVNSQLNIEYETASGDTRSVSRNISGLTRGDTITIKQKKAGGLGQSRWQACQIRSGTNVGAIA